ncbi:MAG: hypothetical protein ABR518_07495 [Actinomycetota bacterium]
MKARLLPMAAVLVVAACNQSTRLDDVRVTPTTVPSSGSPSPTASASPSLEDGRHFGFLESVDIDASPHSLVFDKADFLTGEEANEAAREDGAIGQGESVPNDYYVHNRNELRRTLTFDDDVELVVLDWTNCCEPRVGELEPFAAAFDQDQPSGAYRGPTSPYWVTVEDGQVVEIEEQYLP